MGRKDNMSYADKLKAKLLDDAGTKRRAGRRALTPLKVKAEAVDGVLRISGYANVFNVLDNHGDVVMPGAFRESIADRFPRNLIKLLWQHGEPLGVVTAIKEDAIGLYFDGEITPTAQGLDRFKLIEHGAVDRMSIGFDVLAWEEFDDVDMRAAMPPELQWLPFWRITKMKLWEVSPVTFAANEYATVGAKALDGDGFKVCGEGELIERLEGTISALKAAATPPVPEPEPEPEAAKAEAVEAADHARLVGLAEQFKQFN